MMKKIALTAAATLLVLIGAVTFMPLRAIAGLETPCNYISDLVATNPLSSDLASTGDDHMRCIKLALKTTFPNVNGAVTATDEVLSAAAATNVANVFTAASQEIENAAPRVIIDETDAASNERLYDFASSSGQLLGRTRTDADGAGATWLTVDRTGTTVDSIALAATAITLNGVAASDYPRKSQSNTFTGGTQTIQATTPNVTLAETDAAADNAIWVQYASGEQLTFEIQNDAQSVGTAWASVNRTGTTVDSINLQATAVQINGSPVTWGTYTPTLTSVQNVSSSTARQLQYMRVGNTVTVSGSFNVTATSASTATTIGMSLPVSSSLTQQWNLGGGGATRLTTSDSALLILADATNDRASIDWVSPAGSGGSGLEYGFSFTYIVQ